MAPTAVVATSRSRLGEVLAQWPRTEEDATWAVVLISVVPTAGEMGAIREAAKLCDRVVVARLTPERLPPPGLAELVRAAGGDILFMPSEVTGRLSVSLGGEKADDATVTLVLQTLTTVLPTTVVAPRDGVEVIRVLRGIQGALGDFFTLRIVS